MASEVKTGQLIDPEEMDQIDFVTGESLVSSSKAVIRRYVKNVKIEDNPGDCRVTRYRYTITSKPPIVCIDRHGEAWELATKQDAENNGFMPIPENHLYAEPQIRRKIDQSIFAEVENWYTSSSRNKSFKKLAMEMGAESPTFIASEGLRYSFGVELEVSHGFLPSYELREFNLGCERDGSIVRDSPLPAGCRDVRGWAEYITGPLKGDTGFMQLQKICRALSSDCRVNRSCGLHVHIGGVTFSDEFIVASYMLGILLQRDIFSILPVSRQEGNHCNLMKSCRFEPPRYFEGNRKIMIDSYYNSIFGRISTTNEGPSQRWNKGTNHPRGSKCGYDHGSPRYWWLNLVPAIFVTRGSENSKTIEFRCHSATLNFIKVKNWVKICMAFCKYAQDRPEEIIKRYFTDQSYKLEEIVQYAFPKTSQKLVEYIHNRRELFQTDPGNIKETRDYSEITADINTNIKQLVT